MKKFSRKKTSFVIALVSYLNTGVSIVQGIVLVPLYLELIGSRLYGLWLGSGGVLIALSFLDFGIGRIIIQRVAKNYGKDNLSKAVNYFISGLAIYSSIFLLFTFVGFSISYYIPTWLSASGHEIDILTYCFQIATLVMIFKLINDSLREFQNAVLRPKLAMVTLFVSQVIGVGLTVVLLFRDFGLYSIPIGNLVFQGMAFSVNIILCFKIVSKWDVNFHVNYDYIREITSLVPSLFLGRIGSSSVKKIESTIITIILTPQLTTFFYVTKKAANLLSMLLHIFIGSIFSTYSNMLGEGDKKKSVDVTKTLLTIIIYGGLVGTIVYYLMNEEFVSLWIGAKEYLGDSMSLYIGISIFTLVIFDALTELLMAMGIFKKSNYTLFFEAVSRVLLMATLLYLLGIMGAPLAVIISTVLFAFIQYVFFSQEIHLQIDLKYIVKHLLKLCVFAVLIFPLHEFINFGGGWLGFILKLFVLSSFSALFIMTNRRIRKLVFSLV